MQPDRFLNVDTRKNVVKCCERDWIEPLCLNTTELLNWDVVRLQRHDVGFGCREDIAKNAHDLFAQRSSDRQDFASYGTMRQTVG